MREAAKGVRVKICGVTRPEDARLAVRLGAAFVGLNFYPASPRHVTVERAQEIRRAAPQARYVGVFVNHDRAEVERIAGAVSLDLLQFHGDEGAADIAPFAERAIKVVRPAVGFDPSQLAPYPDCWGFLFDTPGTRLFGGTGESWSYERVAAAVGERPVFVAGGLRPETVADIIDRLPRLYGVDVCSGVESSPGIKDPSRLETFFSEVRHGKS